MIKETQKYTSEQMLLRIIRTAEILAKCVVDPAKDQSVFELTEGKHKPEVLM